MDQTSGNSAISNTESFYTLGIASKLSEISVHSIRRYFDNGLIILHTTTAKRHLFSKVDINRLKSIKKQLSHTGLIFTGIKAIYSLITCWEASRKGEECRNKDCIYCNFCKNQ